MSRIAIFLPSLRGGGAERVMLTLANCFSELGHRVDLVLVQAVGPFLSEVAANVRVIDIGASRALFAVSALRKYLKREEPNALLSAMAHANVVAVLARRLSGSKTRLVISERNHPSCDLAASSSGRRLLTKLSMQWAYPKADCVTSVSSDVADDLALVAKIPRNKIVTIYNPIISEKLIENSKQELDHKWLSLEQNIPVILAVGRLTQQKDFQTLIRSMKIVRKSVDARLIILGEGELRNDLESLIRSLRLTPYVSMPGFVQNPFSYMRKCRVFVLSSRWEGLPGVLIQAMAIGAAVVSTDCPGGSSEILENGRWGRLTPVGNENAMADAILLTMQDSRPPDIGNRMQDFNVNAVVNNYLKELIPGS